MTAPNILTKMITQEPACPAFRRFAMRSKTARATATALLPLALLFAGCAGTPSQPEQGAAEASAPMEAEAESFAITGEYDLMAKVQVREYEHLSDIVTEKMQNTEGVLGTRTMMAFKTYKFHELSIGAPAALVVPPSDEEATQVMPTTSACRRS